MRKKKMKFKEYALENIVIFDGAMGTEILKLGLDENISQGCNEWLNIVAGNKIQQIHTQYLQAGADVIETNTFGANGVVLQEMGLQDQIYEINKAAAQIAHVAVQQAGHGFVAGSIGPGTKLATLNQITYKEIYQAYYPQILALAECNIDLFLMETCQDILHIKCILNIIQDILKKYNKNIPIIVSVTVENSGQLLVGSDFSAIVAILQYFDIYALGINCSTGPENMLHHVKKLREYWNGPLLVMPNAGLPIHQNEKLIYSLNEQEFATQTLRFIQECNVRLIGGCCGTTPAYIKALSLQIQKLASEKEQVKEQVATEHEYVSPEQVYEKKQVATEHEHISPEQVYEKKQISPEQVFFPEQDPFSSEQMFPIFPVSSISPEQFSPATPTLPTSPEQFSPVAPTLPISPEQVEKISPEQKVSSAYLSSLYHAIDLRKQDSVFFIGERLNANGCKYFQDCLLQSDFDGMMSLALDQIQAGAMALDVCVSYVGRDEKQDMQEIVKRLNTFSKVPLVFDSTDADVLEIALQCFSGRGIINSVNLEQGDEKARQIFQLAKKYGAMIVCLAIDEEGMALSLEHKQKIVKRFLYLALDCGLQYSDLIFDLLTFSLGSGDVSLQNSAKETLQGISWLKENFPDVFTTLGVSNVSFGLRSVARDVLNTVFLEEAVQQGLSMAIVNVAKMKPAPYIETHIKNFALDLIWNRNKYALENFLQSMEGKKKQKDVVSLENLSLDEKIIQKIMLGNHSGLGELLQEKLQCSSALDIMNDLLLKSMRRVGVLFGNGKLQLPFVLKSAEVMKWAVDFLQPYLEKTTNISRTNLVLATVRGDVHDIGKNLVDIIVSNNGIQVHNLGVKCEIQTIIDKAREVNASAIGLSGLLVKSTIFMREYLEEMKQQNLDIPVVLGGAALKQDYVEQVCEPILHSPVVYAHDAFDTLRFMKAIEQNCLQDYFQAYKVRYAKKRVVQEDSDNSIISNFLVKKKVQPPFYGVQIIENIDIEEIYSHISEKVLFQSRWKYSKQQKSEEEYKNLLEQYVYPEFLYWKEKGKEFFVPKVLYGYFSCQRKNDHLVLYDDKNVCIGEFSFPRKKICIADAFLEKDVIALQIVTLGEEIAKYLRTLYENNKYKDYFQFHGLAVETTEALATWTNLKIATELQATTKRLSFGFPLVPDMKNNETIYNILQAQQLQITLNETYEMEPEFSTAAFLILKQ